MSGFIEQRDKNQLDKLRDLVLATPELVRSPITTAQVEALLQQDGWSMSRMVLSSAWNGNNITLPVQLGTYSPVPSVWHAKLEAQRAQIERAIPHVGRLETTRGEIEKVEGTGWLVRDNVVVTNRHIARVIRESLTNQGARLRIDFIEEDGDNDEADEGEQERNFEFRIVEILYIAEEPAIDLAFLRIEHRAGAERAVIELGDELRAGMDVCAIGYPAIRDTIYSPDYFFDIFGALLGVKRLSPGNVIEVEPERVSHDCATVGGSSGSVILDLVSGKAVALNYGENCRVNYAVPANIVRDRLARI